MRFSEFYNLIIERKITVIPRRFFGNKLSEREINKKTGRSETYKEPSNFFKRFPIEEYDREGAYFDVETKEKLNGKTFRNGFIDTTGNSPVFETSDEEVEFIKRGKLVQTNLLKPSKYYWIGEDGEKIKPTKSICSVEQKDHFYALKIIFENPVHLSSNPDKGAEPRLRPTSFGNLKFGNIIGKVKLGKIHPCYDVITIG